MPPCLITEFREGTAFGAITVDAAIAAIRRALLARDATGSSSGFSHRRYAVEYSSRCFEAAATFDTAAARLNRRHVTSLRRR